MDYLILVYATLGSPVVSDGYHDKNHVYNQEVIWRKEGGLLELGLAQNCIEYQVTLVRNGF